ncbi:MAG: phosphonate C-P lyase system protein PhnH [Nitrospirae bacterium]|nr:phosphonate C-P lyase system protein PhnH [Nitrospirota bacterium]
MTAKEENLITQKTFTTLLQAVSHPGRVYSLSQELESGLILVIQTLLDHEVAFNVFGHQREEWEHRIIRATSSRTANIEDADFIIIPSGGSDGAILHAKRGSLEYPDTGATVIYSINSLSLIPPIPPFVKGGMRGNLRITLKGPGINGEITPFIGGIKKDEFHYLKEINSEYPLGVDSIFIDAENRIMCIPRSTKIEVI